MAGRAVMLFRPAMMADIDLMQGAWTDARMVWSQWEGYLTSPANEEFRGKLAARGVTLDWKTACKTFQIPGVNSVQ